MSADLIPLLSEPISAQGKPAVSARTLYSFLEMNPAAWARWAKKNIVTNPYAIEHEDWEGFQHEVENRVDTRLGGRPTQDYALSIDFAKKLAMMARSTKGEEARKYFLHCEQLALDAQAKRQLPAVKNPMNQLMIDAVIRIDSLEQVQEEQRLALLAHQAQVITTQQQAIDALTKADQANAKADTALDSQRRFTVAEYIVFEHLGAKVPVSAFAALSRHLAQYCHDHNLPFRRVPVAGKPWPEEYEFHLSVYDAAFPGWVKRRYSQIRLLEGGA